LSTSQAVLQEIVFYEKKYGGLIENTLLNKEKLSEEELNDMKVWRYWLQRAKERFSGSKVDFAHIQI
jgi:hypothetical protein